MFNPELKQLLNQRWTSLPEWLQTPNQVVGRHWVHCAFTMGPAYCSFGCSHCYLPHKSNRVPMPTLDEMKEQIQANRTLTGFGGNIQITGGDLVDAYVKTRRSHELIELVSFAVEIGLVPMLMTHGQGLLENPNLLDRLVTEGGLRKICFHVDVTQAGRTGLSIKHLSTEKQLNSVRDEFVDLVLGCRKRTGEYLTAAHTVTVIEKNLDSIGEILQWLISKPENMNVFQTVSFQTEAKVGRTSCAGNPVTPDKVWKQISQALKQDLPRDNLLFGHPDCTSSVTIVARPGTGKLVNLSVKNPIISEIWSDLIEVFHGQGSPQTHNSLRRKVAVLFRLLHPRRFLRLLRGWYLLYPKGLDYKMLISLVLGKAGGFNIVMHNFIDEDEVRCPTTKVTEERLKACSFRTAIHRNGRWEAVSMCEVNALERPQDYEKRINLQKTQSRSTVTLNPPFSSSSKFPSATP